MTIAIRQRPIKPSRKKFQEALRCLKQAAKTTTIPWTQRLRACELICAIYQIVPLPETSNKHTRKVVRELVEESGFERRVRDELRVKMREQAVQDAEAQARAYLLEQPDGTVGI